MVILNGLTIKNMYLVIAKSFRSVKCNRKIKNIIKIRFKNNVLQGHHILLFKNFRRNKS